MSEFDLFSDDSFDPFSVDSTRSESTIAPQQMVDSDDPKASAVQIQIKNDVHPPNDHAKQDTSKTDTNSPTNSDPTLDGKSDHLRQIVHFFDSIGQASLPFSLPQTKLGVINEHESLFTLPEARPTLVTQEFPSTMNDDQRQYGLNVSIYQCMSAQPDIFMQTAHALRSSHANELHQHITPLTSPQTALSLRSTVSNHDLFQMLTVLNTPSEHNHAILPSNQSVDSITMAPSTAAPQASSVLEHSQSKPLSLPGEDSPISPLSSITMKDTQSQTPCFPRGLMPSTSKYAIDPRLIYSLPFYLTVMNHLKKADPLVAASSSQVENHMDQASTTALTPFEVRQQLPTFPVTHYPLFNVDPNPYPIRNYLQHNFEVSDSVKDGQQRRTNRKETTIQCQLHVLTPRSQYKSNNRYVLTPLDQEPRELDNISLISPSYEDLVYNKLLLPWPTNLRSKAFRCFNCQRAGHSLANCPHPKNDARSNRYFDYQRITQDYINAVGDGSQESKNTDNNNRWRKDPSVAQNDTADGGNWRNQSYRQTPDRNQGDYSSSTGASYRNMQTADGYGGHGYPPPPGHQHHQPSTGQSYNSQHQYHASHPSQDYHGHQDTRGSGGYGNQRDNAYHGHQRRSNYGANTQDYDMQAMHSPPPPPPPSARHDRDRDRHYPPPPPQHGGYDTGTYYQAPPSSYPPPHQDHNQTYTGYASPPPPPPPGQHPSYAGSASFQPPLPPGVAMPPPSGYQSYGYQRGPSGGNRGRRHHHHQ